MKKQTEQSVIHSTFVLERSYPVAPERVFAAFSDPAKKRRWFVDSGGHEVQHYALDFRVGGKEEARFRFTGESPVKGLACATDHWYQDIVPNIRLVMAATMNINGKCISASLYTFELVPTASGTDLIFTHQGAFFEGSGGPEIRKEGWNQLLNRLTEELKRS